MLVFAVTLAIHDEAPSTDFFDPPVVPVSPFVNYSRMAPMTIRSTASRNSSSGCRKLVRRPMTFHPPYVVSTPRNFPG